MVASNFTFKKGKRTTGMRGIGESTPSTIIKISKKEVGYIYTDDSWHGSNDGKWKIKFKIPASEQAKRRNPNKFWTWGGVKVEFDSEQEARDWLKQHFNKLVKQLYIEE